jgi:hypothetical protein
MSRIVKEPEERRKELIDTAERLFIAQGYDQTSISDIAKCIRQFEFDPSRQSDFDPLLSG